MLSKASSDRNDVRSFRAHKDFAVTSGKVVMCECMHYIDAWQWYYEVEVVTTAYLRCGWARPCFTPDPQKGKGVGDDASSFGFAGQTAQMLYRTV